MYSGGRLHQHRRLHLVIGKRYRQECDDYINLSRELGRLLGIKPWERRRSSAAGRSYRSRLGILGLMAVDASAVCALFDNFVFGSG